MTRCWKATTKQTGTRVGLWGLEAWRTIMSEGMLKALLACLRDLHLPTVRAQYEAVARQATAEAWSYPEYLRELLERECQQRRQNRVERLLKASRLPLEKSWASLDLKRLPAKAAQQLRGLLSGDFVDRRENILLPAL